MCVGQLRLDLGGTILGRIVCILGPWVKVYFLDWVLLHFLRQAEVFSEGGCLLWFSILYLGNHLSHFPVIQWDFISGHLYPQYKAM